MNCANGRDFAMKATAGNCFMKTLMKTIAGFVRREWFLLVMVGAIALVIILFEAL